MAKALGEGTSFSLNPKPYTWLHSEQRTCLEPVDVAPAPDTLHDTDDIQARKSAGRNARRETHIVYGA